MPRLYWRRAIDENYLQIWNLFLIRFSITLRPCKFAGSKVETWHAASLSRRRPNISCLSHAASHGTSYARQISPSLFLCSLRLRSATVSRISIERLRLRSACATRQPTLCHHLLTPKLNLIATSLRACCIVPPLVNPEGGLPPKGRMNICFYKEELCLSKVFILCSLLFAHYSFIFYLLSFIFALGSWVFILYSLLFALFTLSHFLHRQAFVTNWVVAEIFN